MNRSLFFLSLGFLTTFTFFLKAQPVPNKNAAEIQLGLKKLNTVGCVLYIAAHPDDENTRLLSYLANERLFRTVYLSLTRGDGGQNLIGNEQGDELGIIRTQELLAARRIDGAEQYFTSAVDFGFSKSPEETFTKWNKEKVLADVVWAIRKFRPDVIITRFPTTGEGGHGHHTASAILAEEAFKAAADPRRFPEQLVYVKPWQAKRLLLNSFIPRGQQAPDLSGQIKLDVGGYNKLSGKSYGEIAADSRSMHKSQGFGVARTRGPQIEYFKKLDGDTIVGEILAGVNAMWSRMDGTEEVQKWVNEAIDYYNPSYPENTLPALIRLYQALDYAADSTWRVRKKADVIELIKACMGLYLEADAKKGEAAPGQEINLEVTVNSRSFGGARLNKITLGNKDTVPSQKLKPNENFIWKLNFPIPADAAYSEPYWLSGPKVACLYPGVRPISGEPENEAPLSANAELTIDSIRIVFSIPVTHKFTDPVKGEVYRPFAITPLVSVNPLSPVVLYSNTGPQKLKVVLSSLQDSVAGTLKPVLPKGWRSEPESVSINLGSAGTESVVQFAVQPPEKIDLSKFVVHEAGIAFESSGRIYNQGTNRIEYDHIPSQFHLEESVVKLVTMEMVTVTKKIGYLEGAGDDVAECLESAGFNVQLLTEAMIMESDLKEYQAIITGIRAYNTNEKIGTYQPRLMKYVQDGGTLIVQYNTSNFLGTVKADVGPYPFKISRNRVTVEEAPVTFLIKDHPALSFPNIISEKDFNGWVQERGLYFATDIDARYKKILQMNDPGEDPADGSLIIADYGSGHFVYTGISFFRQLPAGVPGAYRLMSNLINLGMKP